MIREDLLEFQYYLDRLSKFMQESYGIDEQVRTFHSLLEQVNNYFDEFFREINLFDIKNENGEIIYPAYNFSGYAPLLDNIGAIFNCQRNFTIPHYNNALQVISYSEINLTDDEYLIYIKTQIIKQNFDGTRETLQKLYTTYMNNKIQKGILDLIFIYITDDDPDGAVCNIIWNEDNPTDNLKLLFENGYLTIESMGIRYRRYYLNIQELAKYYKNGVPVTIFNYYYLKQYTLLVNKPDDWDSNYESYFVITNPTVVGNGDPWIENTIYTKNGNDYILSNREPANWDSAYSNYYTITITPNTTSTWSANTFHKLETKGGKYN